MSDRPQDRPTVRAGAWPERSRASSREICASARTRSSATFRWSGTSATCSRRLAPSCASTSSPRTTRSALTETRICPAAGTALRRRRPARPPGPRTPCTAACTNESLPPRFAGSALQTGREGPRLQQLAAAAPSRLRSRQFARCGHRCRFTQWQVPPLGRCAGAAPQTMWISRFQDLGRRRSFVAIPIRCLDHRQRGSPQPLGGSP